MAGGRHIACLRSTAKFTFIIDILAAVFLCALAIAVVRAGVLHLN
jgi:hypothetical protein